MTVCSCTLLVAFFLLCFILALVLLQFVSVLMLFRFVASMTFDCINLHLNADLSDSRISNMFIVWMVLRKTVLVCLVSYFPLSLVA